MSGQSPRLPDTTCLYVAGRVAHAFVWEVSIVSAQDCASLAESVLSWGE